MNLQLSIGITNNPRTWPILDGTVKPEGIDLIPTVLHPSELFWRQLHFSEFAVSEMSCSSFMIVTGQGDTRFLGLPIFTTRRFFHTTILVSRKSGIEKPADLKGKRVGVPEYQQTAALWTRGVLEHEFGVSPKDMEFWMERTPEKSHGGATGFKPPPGVVVHQVPADKSLGAMMLAGELDATVHYLAGPQSGRPQPGRSRQPSRFQIPVSRSDRRRHPLLPQDRIIPDQSSGGGAARHLREGAVGGAEPAQGFQSRRTISPMRSASNMSSITSPRACCPATPRRRCCITASRPTAR